MSRLPAGLLALAGWLAGAGLVAQPPRVDQYGDPLPAGAVARLGTMRLHHGAMIGGVAVSPDGARIASSGHNGAIHLWETSTGKELRRVGAFGGDPKALSLSPDGKTLAVADPGGKLRLFDFAEWRELAAEGNLSNSRVRVEFSSDGATIVLQHSSTPVVELRDAKKLRDIRFTGRADCFALSRDGKTLLVGSVIDKRPRLQMVDVATGQTRDLPPAADPYFLALTPDGKHCVVQDGAHHLSLRETTNGTVVREFATPRLVSILAAALSDDGKTLVASLGAYLGQESDRNRRTALIWDVATGKETLRLHVPGRLLNQISLSRDGKTLVLGGEDGTLHYYELPSGRSPHGLESHLSAVTAFTFAPDGRTLASAGDDGTVRLWEVPTGKHVRVIRGHKNAITGIAFSSDGLLATAGGLDHTVRIWEPATGRERRSARPSDRHPWAVAFAPGGKALAVTFEGAPLQVLDATTLQGGRVGEMPELQTAVCVGYSPDGTMIAVPGRAEEEGPAVVRLLSADSGQEIRALAGQPRQMTDVAFSPDGRLLAACGGDVRVWELASGLEVFRLAGPDRQRGGVAFSPDSRLVAEGATDGSVGIFEVGSFSELKRFAAAPGMASPGTAFSPDGKLLATTYRNTVLLWDVAGLVPAPRRRELTRTQLDAAWTDLATIDGAKAVAAVGLLTADPEHAVPFLRERLAAVSFPNAEHLTKLVADLGAAKFAARQAATNELVRLGRWAESALRQASMTDAEPLRRRAQLLKSFADPSRATEVLRVNRAVWALERIGTPEARAALKALAEKTTHLTDAPSALKRLESAKASAGR